VARHDAVVAELSVWGVSLRRVGKIIFDFAHAVDRWSREAGPRGQRRNFARGQIAASGPPLPTLPELS
jgi:hypothetical protein